jgi:hypothetical protein
LYGPKNDNWLLAIRVYALGPINLVFWPNGPGRTAWAIVGAGSLTAAACLLIWWGPLLNVFEQLQYGAVAWAGVIAVVTILVAASWSRAVATSEKARWPRFIRGPLMVCVLGLVFPGLGQLIAGRRWKAALAVWCAGLLVAAAVIAAHWRWLTANGTGENAFLVDQTIEWILITACSVVTMGVIVWLMVAVDGARHVSPITHSGTVANLLALGLLVTLALFFATLRPTVIARDLGSTAARLESQRLRLIPLALYETAARLDPATPDYLAKTATLNNDLGFFDTADAKRDLLHKRAAKFAGAIGAELVLDQTREAESRWMDRHLETFDRMPPHDRLFMDRPESRPPSRR